MADIKSWKELKQQGSSHYKSEGIEPIDLYRDLGLFWDWALVEISAHALRNRKAIYRLTDIVNADMNKIIHYAELIKALANDKLE